MITQILKEELIEYLINEAGYTIMEIVKKDVSRFYSVLTFESSTSDRHTHRVVGYEISSVVNGVGNIAHFDGVSNGVRKITEKNSQIIMQFSQYAEFYYYSTR